MSCLPRNNISAKESRLELFLIKDIYGPPPRIHLNAVPLHIVSGATHREPRFFAERDDHAY